MRLGSAGEARRIAVRAQLLDGSAGLALDDLPGAWGDTSRLDEAMGDLATWLGASA
jgi:hypothetical protein